MEPCSDFAKRLAQNVPPLLPSLPLAQSEIIVSHAKNRRGTAEVTSPGASAARGGLEMAYRGGRLKPDLAAKSHQPLGKFRFKASGYGRWKIFVKPADGNQIGRASCRERGETSVGGGSE